MPNFKSFFSKIFICNPFIPSSKDKLNKNFKIKPKSYIPPPPFKNKFYNGLSLGGKPALFYFQIAI